MQLHHKCIKLVTANLKKKAILNFHTSVSMQEPTRRSLWNKLGSHLENKWTLLHIQVDATDIN